MVCFSISSFKKLFCCLRLRFLVFLFLALSVPSLVLHMETSHQSSREPHHAFVTTYVLCHAAMKSVATRREDGTDREKSGLARCSVVADELPLQWRDLSHHVDLWERRSIGPSSNIKREKECSAAAVEICEVCLSCQMHVVVDNPCSSWISTQTLARPVCALWKLSTQMH